VFSKTIYIAPLYNITFAILAS